jgi:hypothetical protein
MSLKLFLELDDPVGADAHLDDWLPSFTFGVTECRNLMWTAMLLAA